jgi:redox-sensitive bicupin YhaK (pirin superfamily)
MTYRKIEQTVTGKRAVDGAGVRLVRVIGSDNVRDFDPFLMLDAFDSSDPDDYVRGFPWHPHRGIETVTWLANGTIEHGDSLGNKGTIRDGGCQWMTAGSGIIHQEMPKAAKRMLGLQLWINLPARDKMTEPKYRDLKADMIPVIEKDGARVAVIAGKFRETRGAMQGDHVDATVLDVSLEAGSSISIPVSEKNTVFVYLIDGEISFDEYASESDGDQGGFVERRRAVLLSGGDTVMLTSSKSKSARCVFFSGTPLRESIAWGGPIVMNTQEELDLAFRELDENTFIKHG